MTWQKIIHEIEKALHEIGNELVKDSKREIINKDIRDKGDFYRNTDYIVSRSGLSFRMQIGSNVAHEPWVLGGKQPSWTPVAPIKAWVERKGLAWADKKTGQPLTVEQMAFAIVGKIKREGIEARNVFQDVISDRKGYIKRRLKSIKGVI
jgi:hypothetical protein